MVYPGVFVYKVFRKLVKLSIELYTTVLAVVAKASSLSVVYCMVKFVYNICSCSNYTME